MKNFGQKPLVYFAILVTLISLSSCKNSSSSATQAISASPSPTVTPYTAMARDAGVLQNQLTAKCSDLKTEFMKISALLTQRLSETRSIKDDSLKAAAYMKRNPYTSTLFDAHGLVTKAEYSVGISIWNTNLKSGSPRQSGLPSQLVTDWHGWCKLSALSSSLYQKAEILNTQIYTLQTSATNDSSSTTKAPSSTTYGSWYPSGYNEFSDGVAWQWASHSSFSCTYDTGSCWAINLIARDGCPTGVYAEIAILDKSGVQIDFTNATSTNVPPMQKVRLTFDTFNAAADTARLSKITC